ncbi:MAG: DNA-processing protein DprA, partial [Nitratireductor sp.]
AKRSGSLITARLANENNRLVFSVPGSPLDPRAEGCNHLIRQGAMLVTCVDDIREALAPMGGSEPQLPFIAGEDEGDGFVGTISERSGVLPVDADDALRQRISDALGPSPVDVDDIIHFTGATAGQVQLVLIELDLAGRIERHSGNRVSLQPE